MRTLEKGRRAESWEGKGQEEINEQEENKEGLGGGWDRDGGQCVCGGVIFITPFCLISRGKTI